MSDRSESWSTCTVGCSARSVHSSEDCAAGQSSCNISLTEDLYLHLTVVAVGSSVAVLKPCSCAARFVLVGEPLVSVAIFDFDWQLAKTWVYTVYYLDGKTADSSRTL